MIALAGQFARPSITATQMLDSMVGSPRPTRAEVTDVANAILDGTDAVMLSQETAVGQYPVEAVATMAKIAERIETIAPYENWNETRVQRDDRDPAYTIAFNACAAVRQLDLAAIVVPTLSGRSARLISAHRPEVPIYALSPGRESVRRCSLMWGVQAAAIRRARDHRGPDRRVREARGRARLVQPRRSRGHHRRPAEREAGDDVAAAGAGALDVARRAGAAALLLLLAGVAAPAHARDPLPLKPLSALAAEDQGPRRRSRSTRGTTAWPPPPRTPARGAAGSPSPSSTRAAACAGATSTSGTARRAS